ncbi:MAG TPA: hypothetical protein ENK15_00390 [Thermopetrobacter sp.]|nr:hypothetical protein [Thermopetrobacter sp.]
MNVHAHKTMAHKRGEARERLALFLPASVLRSFFARVPPGKRADFAARAILAALERDAAET